MDLMDFLENEIDDLDQSLIREKHRDADNFAVNRLVVNSKAYHDKFEQLSLPKSVQESVYKQTGRLLDFVDGQPEERLLALDAKTGQLIVDNFNRHGNIYRTGFISSKWGKILECDNNIILIHNHSLNGRPSGQDLLSFLHQDKVQMSIVACHDGTLYAITYVSPDFEKLYKESLDKYIYQVGDVQQAKKLALSYLEIVNDKMSTKNKLFRISKM